MTSGVQGSEITWKSWLMVATLGLTWGATFLVTELALEELTPAWLAALRIAFAALCMLPIWLFLGGRLFETRPTRGAQGVLLAVGAFSTAVPFMLLAWGQQFTTGGFAGVTMASVGLIVLPLAHFLIPGERLGWARVTGFAIGFVGVCVLIGGQAFDSSGDPREGAGRLACLGAACCYAVSSVLMRRLPAVDPIGLSTVILLIAAAMTVPAALWREGLPPVPSPRGIALIVFLGMVPTAAANLLRVLVIRTAGPVFMSLTNYQVPLWSVILGAAFLGEPLAGSLLWAMVLILGGSALSQRRALGALVRGR